MTADRLSARTLAALAPVPRGVRLPGPRPASTGIVHLGLGAFHRAHQAVLTEDAAAETGDDRWGIHGVTQRSARVVDQLAPQDGLYGVLSLGLDAEGAETAALRVVGSVREASYPGRDTARVLSTLAAPSTHVVTLTVTEKGYRRAADGHPDLNDPDLASDLAALADELGHTPERPTEARSPIGLLVRGLAHRRRAGSGPLTVVCCDNLVDNGPALATLVTEVLAATPGSRSLQDWVAEHVRFPATMVDRIVPATAPQHRELAQAMLGLADEGLVVAEPFIQWVIQDDFAGPRPAWERAGATLTDDVAPYERAKLRVLNATHSTLAYAGALRGHATIAEAMVDPVLASLARTLVDQDVLPTLVAPDGFDLAAYRDQVLTRFANPATGHTTVQVAMDGSQKLPIRLLGTVRDRLAAGVVPTASAQAVAAWIAYVTAAARGTLEVNGRRVPLDDPAAGALAAAVDGPAHGLADRFLDLRDVFGDLSDHDGWRAAVRDALEGRPA
ncbi:mannitol dehydrogenase family protein [Actinotalea sp. M2MS4P-6]|uniref:mannitol dehydrogenase family protein n=1 Tax=Actinotalea sp. M2MS4P-6 TaxID=2983762 RepID=UPI0021E4D3AC|nr:mannitol dehydrogenase family protein [Actinotalea sp. M2MS4P-6]MCV2394431.1 mannitol dehydrogenase family protein [Actinotalea sp. M2MS4P-6]